MRPTGPSWAIASWAIFPGHPSSLPGSPRFTPPSGGQSPLFPLGGADQPGGGVPHAGGADRPGCGLCRSHQKRLPGRLPVFIHRAIRLAVAAAGSFCRRAAGRQQPLFRAVSPDHGRPRPDGDRSDRIAGDAGPGRGLLALYLLGSIYRALPRSADEPAALGDLSPADSCFHRGPPAQQPGDAGGDRHDGPHALPADGRHPGDRAQQLHHLRRHDRERQLWHFSGTEQGVLPVMGPLQTYFYLGLVSLILITLGLLFVGVAYRTLRRLERAEHRTPLIFWLIGAAVTVSALFLILGTAGVLYGFSRYGGS